MTPLVHTRALCVRYRTGFAIGPVDLSIDKGIYRLVGRNGAGKTTLLRCLCGAQRVSSGEVAILGRDPLREHRARADVGYLPAVPELPGFLRVDEAWQVVSALRGDQRWDGRALRKHLGLDGRMRLDHASAGQRARAELLVALAGDPPVLLLDEPFGHLDRAGAALLAEYLDSRRSARAILVVSHEEPPLRFDAEIELPSRPSGSSAEPGAAGLSVS